MPFITCIDQRAVVSKPKIPHMPTGHGGQLGDTGKLEKPRVCLGMPLYNQTKFLPEALSSILAQTYRDFRLLVVDDSTETGPEEIIKRFASRDSRISYVKNTSRKGMSFRLNIENASQERYNN